MVAAAGFALDVRAKPRVGENPHVKLLGKRGGGQLKLFVSIAPKLPRYFEQFRLHSVPKRPKLTA